MSDTALVVVDMLNHYRHEDADLLAPNVATIIDPLAGLIETARGREDVDLIYVNDNYGDFTAQFSDIVAAALAGRHPELVRPIVPADGCLLLTKVRHSVFYATALDYLLGRLGTKRVVLAGQVTEQCILYSALDAYVRHYDVVVPADAVAHIDAGLGAAAREMMRRNMSAEVVPAAKCLDSASGQ
ncbi:cysteine hydrolase [Mycolicibacterium farcinogenes]|nr:cysteine hydrolase [Mycolicibacterium farcinogenes]